MNITKFRLRQLRDNANLKGDELGEILGISKTAISKWENGAVFPSRKNLIKIANYFNVTIDYLIGADDCIKENEVLSKEKCELIEIIKNMNEKQILKCKSLIKLMFD